MTIRDNTAESAVSAEIPPNRRCRGSITPKRRCWGRKASGNGDKLDAQGVSWYASKAQRNERCAVCGADLRVGALVLTERVFQHVDVRPKTLHRRCWKRYYIATERQANAR